MQNGDVEKRCVKGYQRYNAGDNHIGHAILGSSHLNTVSRVTLASFPNGQKIYSVCTPKTEWVALGFIQPTITYQSLQKANRSVIVLNSAASDLNS